MENTTRIEQIAYDRGFRVIDGCVISPYGNIRKLDLNKRGYCRFSFKLDNGKSRNVMVHRLVAYIKYGSKIYDDGMCVRHLNAIRTDFSYDNIDIGTFSQNSLDIDPDKRIEIGTYGASFLRKFSDDEIIYIREQYKTGKTVKYLCEMYDVSKSTMSYIVNYKTYKYVK